MQVLQWQVMEDEPKLFLVKDNHPQFPHPCLLPEPTKTSRLGESTVAKEDAKKACSDLVGEVKEMCSMMS